MRAKIIFSLILLLFVGNNAEARRRKSRTKEKKANVSLVKKDNKEQEINDSQDEAQPANQEEIKEEIYEDEETQKIIERNNKNKPRIFKNSNDLDPNVTGEEKQNDILDSKQKENTRLNKERQSGQLISKGVSGDELVGEEFIKWSTAKAKTTSKAFKRMYLENIKMKRILQRIYAKQQGINQSSTNQPVQAIEAQQDIPSREDEIFFIYGKYEDEEGELSGDSYIKWSGLKAKTSAKQFRSLVRRNNFLQTRVQKLMSENRKLTNEVTTLKLRNKRLLRG